VPAAGVKNSTGVNPTELQRREERNGTGQEICEGEA